MLNNLPYGKQWINDDDIKAVVDCLRSDFITQGPLIKQFEDALCEYTGAQYCVVVSSGTAALHLAVAALDLPPGSEGIASTNTFVATTNSLIYNNLTPRLVDIDSQTYNINIEQLKDKINKNTSVILPVHFAGQPCDMKGIRALCDKHGISIIEDASHAIGSVYEDGTKVGNCKFSDLTTFSFHPVKNITCGEGGAITTNDKEIYEKLIMLRSHGITKDPTRMTNSSGPWYYEMQNLGFNYRMTDIQAALGISQLKRLDSFVARRQQIARRYNEAFKSLDWLTVPFQKWQNCSSFHIYVILIDYSLLQTTRLCVMQGLINKKIMTQVHYIPVHLQPYYTKHYGYKSGDFPISEKYYQNTLTIPLYPKMHDEEVEYVISGILSLGRSK